MKNLTHNEIGDPVDQIVAKLREKICQRGNLPYTTVARQLELLEQLTQFELGRFFLQHQGGLNAYWTHYVVTQPIEPVHPLEQFLLKRAPIVLATRERFLIFKKLIQSELKEGVAFASIPCGAMDDLLTIEYTCSNSKSLNFARRRPEFESAKAPSKQLNLKSLAMQADSNSVAARRRRNRDFELEGVYPPLANFSLTGVDLDPASFALAKELAEENGLADRTSFLPGDAWKLEGKNQYDLIASNGLNFYEREDERVVQLYRKFFEALKPSGTLITSFVTPPPGLTHRCEWDMQKISLEDALLQKILLADILESRWQCFRTTDQTRAQLEKAGFTELQFIRDSAGMFPTVRAKKNERPLNS